MTYALGWRPIRTTLWVSRGQGLYVDLESVSGTFPPNTLCSLLFDTGREIPATVVSNLARFAVPAEVIDTIPDGAAFEIVLSYPDDTFPTQFCWFIGNLQASNGFERN